MVEVVAFPAPDHASFPAVKNMPERTMTGRVTNARKTPENTSQVTSEMAEIRQRRIITDFIVTFASREFAFRFRGLRRAWRRICRKFVRHVRQRAFSVPAIASRIAPAQRCFTWCRR